MILPFCLIVFAVFAAQSAFAQVPAAPAIANPYNNLMLTPPYFSLCDFPSTTYWDLSVSQTFNSIASTYNINYNNLAQWYSLITMNCATLPLPAANSILNGFSSLLRDELSYRGISTLPPFLACSSELMQSLAASPAYLGSVYPEMSLLDRNIFSILDRSVAPLSPQTLSSLESVLAAYLPTECMPYLNDILGRMSYNFRFELGYASHPYTY
ncbi:hypothetical protein PGB90_005975 [Kerria lacca]